MYRFLISLGAAVAFALSPISFHVDAQEESIWRSPLQKCWAYSAEDLPNLKSASDNESTIIVPFELGVIKAVDTKTGKPLWTKTIKGSLTSGLHIDTRILYFANTTIDPSSTDRLSPQRNPSHTLYSIDIDSGINIWTRQLNVLLANSRFYIVSNGSDILVANKLGEIAKLRKLDGSIVWQKSLGTSLSGKPIIFDRKLFFSTENKTVVILSKDSGEILNQVASGVLPTSMGAFQGGVIVGDRLGGIRSLKLPTGVVRWRTRTGGKIRHLGVLGANILAISDDNYIYSISETNGKKLWKRKLSGRILGSVVFEERIGVFLSSGSTEAVLIDLDSGKIVNRIVSEQSEFFVGAPIAVAGKIILPTNTGLEAYSPNCSGMESSSNSREKINPKERKHN